MISILMPTCDRHDRIGRAIRSILDQTYEDWQLVVLDNGENSVEVFDDPRIDYYYRPHLRGHLVEALNTLTLLANGDIFTWLSDDDYLPPDALEHGSVLEHEGNWLNGLTRYTDDNDTDLFTDGGRYDRERLLERMYMGPALYWRSSLHDRLGGFDEEMGSATDYDWVFRLGAYDPNPVFVEEVMYVRVEHEETWSALHREEQMAETQRVLQKHR